MIKTKKQLFTMIGAFLLVIMLGTITYAFFNYTRTGSSNIIKVGRISFNALQGNGINLDNVFPIDKSKINEETDYVGSVTIHVTGDTTYSEGVEYLVSAVNVNNSIVVGPRTKTLPMSISVDIQENSENNPTTSLGTEEDDYFDIRGENTSVYKVLANSTVKSNDQLVAGYIAPGDAGIDGNVVIKAYLDKDKITISDTYPQGNIYELNQDKTSGDIQNCVQYFIDSNYDNFYEGETLESFCDGTGTLYGEDMQFWLENNWFNSNETSALVRLNIVKMTTNGTTDEWVKGRTVFTTEEWNSLQSNGVSFQIKVEANEGIWVDNPKKGYIQIKKYIEEYSGDKNKIRFIDTMDTSSNENDDIIYFSGNKNDINFNYVWYSGKLWRVTAIYPDGKMKLVTDDVITTMNTNDTVEFNNSWVYQWLNEDFYNTLYNGNNIISTANWNYSADDTAGTVRPESIATQKIATAKVGMLTSYELRISYRNNGNDYYSGYLRNGYYNMLITPYDEHTFSRADSYGYVSTESLGPQSSLLGVRPAIIVNSDIVFEGNGTRTSPYIIVGDKSSPINNTTLINDRLSGEYVNFDGELYRIVGVNANGTTKLVKYDYVRSTNNTILKKQLASTNYYGKNTNTQSDDYWDYYLNNTWYNGINSTYRDMLVDDIYYIDSNDANYNYKALVCKDSNLANVTIGNCNKYTSIDVDKTFTGKVGIGRIGEMFTAQHGVFVQNYDTFSEIYAINNIYINTINKGRNLDSINYSVYPTITLKNDIKITGGLGTINNPFEIG